MDCHTVIDQSHFGGSFKTGLYQFTESEICDCMETINVEQRDNSDVKSHDNFDSFCNTIKDWGSAYPYPVHLRDLMFALCYMLIKNDDQKFVIVIKNKIAPFDPMHIYRVCIQKAMSTSNLDPQYARITCSTLLLIRDTILEECRQLR